MHYCAYHKTKEPEENFRLIGKEIDSWCIEGRKEYNRAYSKKQYAARKAEVAEEKKAREKRTSQICTKCEEDKPVNAFSERSDRPGKLHSRCKKCRGEEQAIRGHDYHIKNRDSIRENKREYRNNNRDKVRQLCRKRKAQKDEVRSVPYLDKDIRQHGGAGFLARPDGPSLRGEWGSVRREKQENR